MKLACWSDGRRRGWSCGGALGRRRPAWTIVTASIDYEQDRSGRSRPRRAAGRLHSREYSMGSRRSRPHPRRPGGNAPMLYFGAGSGVNFACHRGGTTIGDVIRRAWSRLIRKQWLFLYPVCAGRHRYAGLFRGLRRGRRRPQLERILRRPTSSAGRTFTITSSQASASRTVFGVAVFAGFASASSRP